MSVIFGVDVHPEYQRGFDFKRAASQGYKFCIIKISEGPYRDGSTLNLWQEGLRDFAKRAEDAFEYVGYYAYLLESDPLNKERSGRLQAQHFLAVVDELGGTKGKLLVADFEGYGPSGGEYYYLSPSNATLKHFISTVKAETNDHPVILYTSPGYWNEPPASGHFGNYKANALWLANYPDMNNHNTPREYYESIAKWGANKGVGGKLWDIWQYTSKGLVADMYVDVNALRGGEEKLQKLSGKQQASGDEPEKTYLALPRTIKDENLVVELRRPRGSNPKPKPKPEPNDGWHPGQGDSLAPPGFTPKAPKPESSRYDERHPTRYGLRDDVAAVARKAYREFGGPNQIHINTYLEHPGCEIVEDPYYCGRDRTSFDVWGPKGRGDPIGRELGQKIRNFLFNLPGTPLIEWIVWDKRIWERGVGEGPFGTDPFSWHEDHIHVTYVGPQHHSREPGEWATAALSLVDEGGQEDFIPLENFVTGNIKKPRRKRRPIKDIDPKVRSAGVWGLVIAGLLSMLEQQTGIAAPEGLDAYIVALAAFAAGWLKDSGGKDAP